MASINKVILVGNVGRVDVRETSAGVVVEISLATSDKFKDKTTGEQREITEWHKVVFFKRLAEIVQKYITKGSLLYVEGSLKTSKYQKDGVDTYSTKIVGHNFQMLDRKAESSGGGEAKYTPETPAKPKPDPQSEAPDLGGIPFDWVV